MRDAGVVDEYVESSPCGGRGIEYRVPLRGIDDIVLHELRIGAEPLRLGFASDGIDVGNQHFRAFGEQCFGGGQAEPTRAATEHADQIGRASSRERVWTKV